MQYLQLVILFTQRTGPITCVSKSRPNNHICASDINHLPKTARSSLQSIFAVFDLYSRFRLLCWRSISSDCQAVCKLPIFKVEVLMLCIRSICIGGLGATEMSLRGASGAR